MNNYLKNYINQQLKTSKKEKSMPDLKTMQEWWEKNDISVYSTHNKDNSVIIERFIKTLKTKIYQKMVGDDSKSYLPYLNKLSINNQ